MLFYARLFVFGRHRKYIVTATEHR